MKIRNQNHLKGCIISTLFLLTTVMSMAQSAKLNQYGLHVISDRGEYDSIAKSNRNKKMISLKKLIPGIVLDLRYASDHNFTKRCMYPSYVHDTYLRLPAAKALLKVQQYLKKQGYGLKIFDAYRPYSVTVAFWELVKDERYAANPAKGSGHNRGIAVDLTIIDLKTKKEMDMGIGFDNFSDTAHHDFISLSSHTLQNRKLLSDTMEKFGFKKLDTEWWHYYWPDAGKYELLDLSFDELKQQRKIRK
jgi:D-alanyl-D-alanine dipeptidase